MIPQTQLQSHQPQSSISNLQFHLKQRQSYLPPLIFIYIRHLYRYFAQNLLPLLCHQLQALPKHLVIIHLNLKQFRKRTLCVLHNINGPYLQKVMLLLQWLLNLHYIPLLIDLFDSYLCTIFPTKYFNCAYKCSTFKPTPKC